MKYAFFAIIIAFTMQANAQQHQLKKIWETDPVVATPESVLYDQNAGLLYVSLIDGGPLDADGKGGIAKLSTDEKNYDSTWITGLNAPKGLGIFNNRLYAADLTEVVVIDVPEGKVEKKIAIPNSQMLNDITVSDQGIVYVSDSKTGKVHRIENDIPTLYLENLQGVNGLKAVGDLLYIGSGKSFVKANKNKQITMVAALPESIDGIESVGNGDFVLTSWVGVVYYVDASGKSETLLDTREQKKNAADLGFDPVKKVVFIPTFLANSVAAYQLQ